ncbi:MAG: capsule assembly Wzi family protein, partial [Terriglobales bacterium]
GQYGQSLSPQPFIEGAKISFRFTPNLEFNMAKTTIYGGPGNPLTPKTLFQSAFSLHVNGEALGDGRVAWDFTYRVPKMRNWLSVYGEVLEEDEPFPINHMGKAAFQGGLYFAKLPGISRMDLRLEGGSTSPVNFPTCNGCYYSHFRYLNGYESDGNSMGSWLGRAAQGEGISSTYWLGAQKKITAQARHRVVDRQFLPQGGTQDDVAVNVEFPLRSGFHMSGKFQYESWLIPLLVTRRQSNILTSFQISYQPGAHSH